MRSPDRSTVPSTTASTSSSRAICGNGLRVPLYGMTEVREMTLNERTRANSVINESVMPSTKYSCVGSFDRFCSGKTAREVIAGRGVTRRGGAPQRPFLAKKTGIATKTRQAALKASNLSRDRGWGSGTVPVLTVRATELGVDDTGLRLFSPRSTVKACAATP